jgi:hypothetical protein
MGRTGLQRARGLPSRLAFGLPPEEARRPLRGPRAPACPSPQLRPAWPWATRAALARAARNVACPWGPRQRGAPCRAALLLISSRASAAARGAWRQQPPGPGQINWAPLPAFPHTCDLRACLWAARRAASRGRRRATTAPPAGAARAFLRTAHRADWRALRRRPACPDSGGHQATHPVRRGRAPLLSLPTPARHPNLPCKLGGEGAALRRLRQPLLLCTAGAAMPVGPAAPSRSRPCAQPPAAAACCRHLFIPRSHCVFPPWFPTRRAPCARPWAPDLAHKHSAGAQELNGATHQSICTFRAARRRAVAGAAGAPCRAPCPASLACAARPRRGPAPGPKIQARRSPARWPRQLAAAHGTHLALALYTAP